jgi:hypothetical protein
MTDRELTPAEAEAAAMLEADIRRRLEGQPITRATLTEAAIAALDALGEEARRPRDHREMFTIVIDPADPNRVLVSGPGVELMQRLAVYPQFGKVAR